MPTSRTLPQLSLLTTPPPTATSEAPTSPSPTSRLRQPPKQTLTGKLKPQRTPARKPAPTSPTRTRKPTQQFSPSHLNDRTFLNLHGHMANATATVTPYREFKPKAKQREPKQREPKQREPKQREPMQREPKQREPKQREPLQLSPLQHSPPPPAPQPTSAKRPRPPPPALATTNRTDYGVLTALLTPATILIVPGSHLELPPTSDEPNLVHRSALRRLHLPPGGVLVFTCGLIHSGDGRPFEDEFTPAYQSPVGGVCVGCNALVTASGTPNPPLPDLRGEAVCQDCAVELPVRAHFYMEGISRHTTSSSTAHGEGGFMFDPTNPTDKPPLEKGAADFRVEGRRGDMRIHLCGADCASCPATTNVESIVLPLPAGSQTSTDACHRVHGDMSKHGFEVWSPGPLQHPIKPSDVLCSQFRPAMNNKAWEPIFNRMVDPTMLGDSAIIPATTPVVARKFDGQRYQLKLDEKKKKKKKRSTDEPNALLSLTDALTPLLTAFPRQHRLKDRLTFNTPVLLFCDPGTPDQTLHRDWPRHLCNPKVEIGERERGL